MSCSLRGETEIRSVFQANNYQNMFTQRACLNLYHILFTNTHTQVMSQGYIILIGKYNTTPPFLKFVQNYLLSIFSRALSEGFIIVFGLLRIFKGGITGLSETDTGLD